MIDLNPQFDWVQAMKVCPQDPQYHAEGDVLTHTQMVCDELEKIEAFKVLKPEQQDILRTAAKLHDIGKPATTKHEDDGHISAKHHSAVGAIMARKLLWELNIPFETREVICNLVRWHMRPPHWLNSNPRYIIECSLGCPMHLLCILCEADNRGRIGSSQKENLETIELLGLYAAERHFVHDAFWFASDHSRYMYFNYPEQNRFPEETVYDDTRCSVTVMSGLPGAGKDHWIKHNVSDTPIVSLDAIREELGVAPNENQAMVLRMAQARARYLLGKKCDFVWNATNISGFIRRDCFNLFKQYNAKIKIVYVEVPKTQLFAQNKNRPKPVPENVIEGLIEKWEVPSLRECHSLATSTT